MNTFSLRCALGSNATFSLACGLIMLLQPGWVENWLGVEANAVIQTIGLGLIVFSTDLAHQATRPRMATWRALYASAADFLWVIGSLIFLVFFSATLSFAGVFLILSTAGIVFVFSCWQWIGIGQAHRAPKGSLYRHCLMVSTSASPEAMWKLLVRLGDIHKFMPALKTSKLLGDSDQATLGAVRVCQDQAGKQWAEEVVDLRPGRGFTVRFLSERPGFPFPAREMHGGWEVLPGETDGSTVMVWWELDPKPRWLGPMMLPLLAWQVDRVFPKVVEAMAWTTTANANNVQAVPPPSAPARLLPSVC